MNETKQCLGLDTSKMLTPAGAVTLGRYIFFTGNYENTDTQSWLELLGHEVKHSEQAKRKGPAGYLPEYVFRIGTTAIKEGTTDEGEIHKKHSMESCPDKLNIK